jgi:preprotein translocase subunit SecA
MLTDLVVSTLGKSYPKKEKNILGGVTPEQIFDICQDSFPTRNVLWVREFHQRSLKEILNGSSPLSSQDLLVLVKILALSSGSEQYASKLFEFGGLIKQYYGSGFFVQLFDPRQFVSNQSTSIKNGADVEVFLTVCETLYNRRVELSKDYIVIGSGGYHDLLDSLPKWTENGKEQTVNNLSLTNLSNSLAMGKELNSSVKSLEESVNHFRGSNPNLSFSLSDEDVDIIHNQFLDILNFEDAMKADTSHKIREYISEIKSESVRDSVLSTVNKLRLLAIARQRVQKEFGIYPHDTQILTVLALTSSPSQYKGRLAQVRTGEGKSVISCLTAICLAMNGQCVDIITSSRSLAERDRKKFVYFFEYFGISISDICEDVLSPTHFSGQVIFGTNYDFEFSILRQRSFESKARIHYADQAIPRPCDAVLIDEVDNLLIDKASSAAIIAIARKDKLLKLYEYIFVYISAAELDEVAVKVFDKNAAYTALQSNLASVTSRHLIELFQTESKDRIMIYIENCVKALYSMKQNKEYIIQTSQIQNVAGENVMVRKVICVDENTGVLMESSRWQHGVHEFLEFKHGIAQEEESIAFDSLCHPVFFSYYKSIYGLTGTIGSEAERREVEDVYHVQTFQVPTHRPSRREEYAPRLTVTKEEYFSYIEEDIRRMYADYRPTLILCANIDEACSIESFVRDKLQLPCSLFNSVQHLSENYVLSRAGNVRAITIATNVASRGTDIILSEESISKGGLHVIVTYFPENLRIEQQAIGRSARQGQPGTNRIIIPPTDPTFQVLQKIYPVNSITYEMMLALREQNIAKHSHARTIHSKIDMHNSKFTTEFFQYFALAEREIDVQTDLKKKDELLHQKEEISLDWANLFDQLSVLASTLLKATSEEGIHEGDPYLSSGMISYRQLCKYTDDSNQLYSAFKSRYPAYFQFSKLV